MSTSPKNRDDQPTPPDTSTVVLLLGTIGDTTWRMFVPTIGMTLVGVAADNTFGTKPWLTVAGIMFGTALAALLVRRQLQKVKK